MSSEPNIDPSILSIDEAAARRDADIIAQLDEQQAIRNASSGNSTAPLVGLAVITALSIPLLFATLRGGPSTAVAPAGAPPAPVAEAGAPPVPTYINWNYSFEGAQQQAASTNKPMLVEFYTDWCGVCKKMDANVYPDPAVVAETQNVVPVKINAETRTDLAQRYNIRSYPTYIWMDSTGNERNRVSASFTPANFVALMHQNR